MTCATSIYLYSCAVMTQTYRHRVSWLELNFHDPRSTGSKAELTPRTMCTCPVLPAWMTSRRSRQRAPRSRGRGRRRRRRCRRCLATSGTWLRSPGCSVGDDGRPTRVWQTWNWWGEECWCGRVGRRTGGQRLNRGWLQALMSSLLNSNISDEMTSFDHDDYDIS